MIKTVLVIGAGQIGKAIARRILDFNPEKVIFHNLTKSESDFCVKYFQKFCNDTELISSYGDVFMPYELNKAYSMEEKLQNKEALLDFYYSEFNDETLKLSTIYNLVAEYRPDIIIDAMNSGTVLGCNFNPDAVKNIVHQGNVETDTVAQILLNDFVPKAINFVYSLKLAMEEFGIQKYLKVSTTGLGGMGMNMPYTHGDTPKSALSYALMGKVSAAGVLHQLLWSLSHTNGLNISLIVPSTYVGYDSAKFEPIETDVGLIKKLEGFENKILTMGEKLAYSDKKENSKYLEFPVVRAGENHVYSLYELNALTAVGQMEAITKEEVADAAIEDILGRSKKNLLNYMDAGTLGPTFAGRVMSEKSKKELMTLMKDHNVTSIATGNLGATVAKELYELYLIKAICGTVDELKNKSAEEIYVGICDYLNKNSSIITEMISLGLPVIKENNEIYIGNYSLYPTKHNDLTITPENLEKWSKVAWVDLRIKTIKNWRDRIIEIYNDAMVLSSDRTFKLNRAISAIENDYDIGELLAYHFNMQEKGRKKSNT